jgi:hypothetical protein
VPIYFVQSLHVTSPYTKRSLDLWPWPIWFSQISSNWGNWWIFDFLRFTIEPFIYVREVPWDSFKKNKLYITSPYTKRSLDLWPWPIWLRQISSKQSHCWIFDFWDSRRCRYINYWGPLCPIFLFNNYIWPLLTPRGLLTLDPDLFGCAKFRQNKAIDEFLIFEIPDPANI